MLQRGATVTRATISLALAGGFEQDGEAYVRLSVASGANGAERTAFPMGRTLLALIAVGCFSGLALTAGAQGGGVLSVDSYEKGAAGPVPEDAMSPMGAEQGIGDIPGLTVTAPAPDWIAPGLRLTYYTMSGSLPNGPHEYTLDPEGRWEDKHGNRYTRSDLHAGGSNGLFQFNVVGMDQQRVALQMLFYLYEGLSTAEPSQRLETGYIASTSTGGDLWLHPEALKTLVQKYGNQPPPRAGQQGMWVSSIRKTIDQATYNAALIALMAESGSRRVWIYDLASGILLYSSDISQIGAKVVQDARVSPGGSMVKFTTFKGSRALPLPWSREPVPAWLGRASTFRYSGTFQVTVPGSPGTPFPVNVGIQVTERGPDWLKFEASFNNQAPGVESELTTRVHGNNMLCGSWIPPTALGLLQAGQVLDTDHFTHVTTQVGSANQQYVTLVANSPRQQIQYTYRRSDGLLVKTLLVDRFNQLGMSNQIELSLVSMQ